MAYHIPVFFLGGLGVLSPPPPLEIGLLYIYYIIMGIAPLSPLKFAAMHLSPLERNPEINPACVYDYNACTCMAH